jgi:RimJ/RimL family protein N-acetyltransferase
MDEPSKYDTYSIHNLFKKYNYQVSVKSTLQGKLKGKLYVDELENPKTGVLLNPEGVFIAGNPTNQHFNEGLSGYLENIIQTGKHPTIEDTDDLWFYIDDPQWRDSFLDIFKSRIPFKVGRFHYTVKLPALDWKEKLPKGYTVKKADISLNHDSLNFPGDVWDWVKYRIDELLNFGFGSVLVKGTDVVSWSTADCISGDRCEIGIITTEKMRRKGFGSVTVLAALDFCNQMGFREVGWHCEAHNWGSIATAEKVGFEKVREYFAWVCKFDADMHVKEKAIVEKYYP